MAVVCDTCKTHNRDNAMFCRGCAGKLPGFAATGPSALAALRAEPSAPASARPTAPQRPARQALRPIEAPVFWIRLGLAIVMMAVGFVGWYMYVTRKAPPPPGPVVAATTVSASAPRGLPLTLLTPVEPVEFIDPPQPVQPAARLLPAPTPLPAPSLYTEPRRPVRTAAVAHTAVADPRSGCGHLNFIAAARCEAAQCDRPGYSQHPRCDAVRADRRRDEARRNPLMAY
ncbi:hypothetical protein [Variovorax fucosicus]|uniref:hypothetical protein n=1 Tax=Variovorax fucosicus TaxID=3053517 RepID=UPI0025766C83|nr:hypothetical protein [Variovorax sp. J22G47]MDM0057975.1 hypothetical protein [Variovorax sp. J22G47]